MSWVIQDEEKAKAAGATEMDEVLYVITIRDLLISYEALLGEEAWDRLSADRRASLAHRVKKYMENFYEDGTYTFGDALEDAVRDEVEAWGSEPHPVLGIAVKPEVFSSNVEEENDDHI
jgi:hypothetical protein